MSSEVQGIHGAAKPYLPAAEKSFGSAQAFTACFAAYSHGAGDVSNEVAPFAAIWATYQAHHYPSDKHAVDIWVYAARHAVSLPPLLPSQPPASRFMHAPS